MLGGGYQKALCSGCYPERHTDRLFSVHASMYCVVQHNLYRRTVAVSSAEDLVIEDSTINLQNFIWCIDPKYSVQD